MDEITKSSYECKNYNKREKSLDITRNNDDEYEIVLSYQRSVKSNKKYKNVNNDSLFLFIHNHDINTYEISNQNLDIF